MGAPRSLLLITVDCLRADHVGFLGYRRGTTPFLDSLAAQSLILPNAIVGGSPTYYSFPAIMASRFPLGLGRDLIGLAPGEPTLATALHDSGYATAAFVAGNVYLGARFGYDNGFESFHDFLGSADVAPRAQSQNQNPGFRGRLNQRLAKFSEGSGILGSIYSELYFRYGQWAADSKVSYDQARRAPAADILVDRACDWLGGLAGKPFFLWLHFMDAHAPYYPREQAFQLLGEPPMSAARAVYLNSFWRREGMNVARYARHKKDIVTLYDAAVRWVDAQVARLADRLRELRLWDDCMFAFTADHGEEFLDHGGRYHSPSKVTEELIQVPLLLHAPAGSRTGISPQPFSFLDLAPTLLDAAGDIVPPLSFRGQSRWSELQQGKTWNAPTVTECVSNFTSLVHRRSRMGSRVVAVREARFKLVFDFHLRLDFLFDLETDPKEQNPLPPDTQKEVRKRLLERLRDHLSISLRSRDQDVRLDAFLRDVRLEIGASGPDSVSRSDALSET